MVHQVEQEAKHTKQILVILGKLDKKLDAPTRKEAMLLLHSYCNQLIYQERTYNIRLTKLDDYHTRRDLALPFIKIINMGAPST